MIISSFLRWLKFSSWIKIQPSSGQEQALRDLFFNHFLKGTCSIETNKQLAEYSTKLNCWARDIYEQDLSWQLIIIDKIDNQTITIIDEDKEKENVLKRQLKNYQETKRFLEKMCITHQGKIDSARIQLLMENNKNLYQLLIALENDGDASGQTWQLKKAINANYPKNNWLDVACFSTMLTATGICVYGANFDYLLATFDWLAHGLPDGIVWLVFTLSSPQIVPFLGIAFHALLLITKCMHAAYYGTALNPFKNTYIPSEILRISLILSGHVLTALYLGVACMSLPIALVFIAASVVELIHSLFQLYQQYHKPTPEQLESHDHAMQMYVARIQNTNDRLLAEVYLHAATIMCLAAIVCCWNLFPPSLLLSLGCVLFIVSIIAAEGIFKNILNDLYSTRLQNKIADIDHNNPSIDMHQSDDIQITLMQLGLVA